MRTAVELAELISVKTDAIMDLLSQSDIEKYRYLETNYAKIDVCTDEQYIRKFRGYYIMRYPSEKYTDRFFELFQRQKIKPLTFAEMSMELYNVERKHQLSFISKLFHTIDDSRPIFDRHVYAAFKMDRHRGTIEKMISEDERLLEYMSATYQQMETLGLITKPIRAFDSKFTNNGISFVKKADFLIWKLGEILQTEHPEPQTLDIKLGRYRHFKGNEYLVLHIAKHSETQEPMVVYQALYGERGIWVRPASMWNEVVERDGVSIKRFTYIGD